MAKNVYHARVASAVMRGLLPESVPVMEERMVGGVMVPVGTGLRPMRSGIRISEPWGTAHPAFGQPVGQKVDFSVEELRMLSTFVATTSAEFPDAKVTKLASRVLLKVQSDTLARPIFHERHIVTSDRLKTGIIRLRKLQESGELDLLFNAAKEAASSDNEAWQGLSVNELIRFGKLGAAGLSFDEVSRSRRKRMPEREYESESESEETLYTLSDDDVEEVEEVEEVEVLYVETTHERQKNHKNNKRSPEMPKRKRIVVDSDEDEESE